MLKHQGGFSTRYAHLSSFTSGLRRGTRVHQGDVIGHVGQTGWATGPHLHYEFRVNDQVRDPLTVALPEALPVPATSDVGVQRRVCASGCGAEPAQE